MKFYRRIFMSILSFLLLFEISPLPGTFAFADSEEDRLNAQQKLVDYVKEGNLEKVKEYLTKGKKAGVFKRVQIDVNWWVNGESALDVAIKNDRKEIVEYLLNHNGIEPSERTLVAALDKGNVDLAKRLIDPAKRFFNSDRLDAALKYAALRPPQEGEGNSKGHFKPSDTVRFLWENGASTARVLKQNLTPEEFEKLMRGSVPHKADTQRDALYSAILNRALSISQKPQDASKEAQTKVNDSKEIARELLKRVKPNLDSLKAAVESEDWDLIQETKRAYPTAASRQLAAKHALLTAAGKPYSMYLQDLEKTLTGDPNIPPGALKELKDDVKRLSPQMLEAALVRTATPADLKEKLELLQKLGVDVNRSDEKIMEGMTPLMFAILRKPEFVNVLLNAGADPAIRGSGPNRLMDGFKQSRMGSVPQNVKDTINKLWLYKQKSQRPSGSCQDGSAAPGPGPECTRAANDVQNILKNVTPPEQSPEEYRESLMALLHKYSSDDYDGLLREWLPEVLDRLSRNLANSSMKAQGKLNIETYINNFRNMKKRGDYDTVRFFSSKGDSPEADARAAKDLSVLRKIFGSPDFKDHLEEHAKKYIRKKEEKAKQNDQGTFRQSQAMREDEKRNPILKNTITEILAKYNYTEITESNMRKVLRNLHPDKHRDKTPEVQEQMNEKFKEISNVWENYKSVYGNQQR